MFAAYDLRGHECAAEEEAGALGEGPAAGARHEDERLADDAHLQVQRRHHLVRAAAQRPHAERLLFQITENSTRQKKSTRTQLSRMTKTKKSTRYKVEGKDVTEKKSVLRMAQKKATVMTAR
jgi:hypothetical protein